MSFDDDTNERLVRQSSYMWSHAFARFSADSGEILGRYGSNHVHGVPGDWTRDLRGVCRLLDIDVDTLGEASWQRSC